MAVGPGLGAGRSAFSAPSPSPTRLPTPRLFVSVALRTCSEGGREQAAAPWAPGQLPTFVQMPTCASTGRTDPQNSLLRPERPDPEGLCRQNRGPGAGTLASTVYDGGQKPFPGSGRRLRTFGSPSNCPALPLPWGDGEAATSAPGHRPVPQIFLTKQPLRLVGPWAQPGPALADQSRALRTSLPPSSAPFQTVDPPLFLYNNSVNIFFHIHYLCNLFLHHP